MAFPLNHFLESVFPREMSVPFHKDIQESPLPVLGLLHTCVSDWCVLCPISGRELLERLLFWGASFVWPLEYVICLYFFVLHFWLDEHFWKVEFSFWSWRGKVIFITESSFESQIFDIYLHWR